jgi:ABC-type Fe3+ transport system permease subunit
VASQLLYDSTTRPVSVQIGEHFRTDPDAAAALSFCLMALSAAAVGAGAWVQRRARK